MSDNKTLRSTVSYLIARDHAHELAFAKALGESLGVNLGQGVTDPKLRCNAVSGGEKTNGPRCAPKAAPLSSSTILKWEKSSEGRHPLTTASKSRRQRSHRKVPPLPLYRSGLRRVAPGLTPELMQMVAAVRDFK